MVLVGAIYSVIGARAFLVLHRTGSDRWVSSDLFICALWPVLAFVIVIMVMLCGDTELYGEYQFGRKGK